MHGWTSTDKYSSNEHDIELVVYMASSRIGVRESLIVACAHATFLRRHTDFFFQEQVMFKKVEGFCTA